MSYVFIIELECVNLFAGGSCYLFCLCAFQEFIYKLYNSAYLGAFLKLYPSSFVQWRNIEIEQKLI